MTSNSRPSAHQVPSSTLALGSSIFAALLIASLEMIFVISFTALIYSGELSSQIPQALSFTILGNAVLCMVIAFLSSTSGIIAVEQDMPGVMLSVVAAGVISALAGAAKAQFATVTMMIVITSVMTGVLLLLIGVFKLGGLARFIPYPIIGGFLAGTGWLLIQGAIGLMTDVPLGWAWFQWDVLRLWIPGIVLGIVIHYATQKINKPYVIPALMLFAALLFYGIVWLSSASFGQIQALGWLLNSSVSGGVWQFPFGKDILSHVDWDVLLRQLPALIPISAMSVVALLLNSSGLELIIKKDIDLNRELIAAGIGNLAAGMTGGLTGFQDISFSTLNHSMNGGKRLVGIFAGLFMASTLIIGTSAILYIPKFIFGSMLVFLGLQLLLEWVYAAWFKFSRSDFLVILTILMVIVFSGFLQAIIAGLVLAVGMFAVSYSRISVIKFALSGREYHSRVTRNLPEQQILDTHGDQIHILKLEGFIFFGTANGIFIQIRDLIRLETNRAVKYVLLDFSKVSGVDSTGMLSFARMMQWSREQEITLVLTGLTGNLRAQFLQASQQDIQDDSVQFFADLDHGLEWCENEIVAKYFTEEADTANLAAQLSALAKSGDTEKLLAYFQRREYASGEYLIKEGDAPDLMYFIEAGQVTAQLEAPGKKPVRLETMHGGRTVGELGFYLKTPRAANVIADKDSVVYTLSIEDLSRMETDDPEFASVFHRMIVLLLSQRVNHLLQSVRALERE